MLTDPASLARVSREIVDAMRAAQAFVETGEFGGPLVEAIRRAREVHDILVDGLSAEHGTVEEFADGALAELGDRLCALERYLTAH